ncbi:hypothetical protein AAFF_G00183560 [Aldrovandia affinis]|uniref:Uncharacterized protein n=1 Tax=Aldrovandia affinis TaxID=143900 RepID=A0AAD7RJU5_9TELE|nr:hypothetical protein AAFF_G00183560 [Aldrovandia affinis]
MWAHLSNGLGAGRFSLSSPPGSAAVGPCSGSHSAARLGPQYVDAACFERKHAGGNLEAQQSRPPCLHDKRVAPNALFLAREPAPGQEDAAVFHQSRAVAVQLRNKPRKSVWQEAPSGRLYTSTSPPSPPRELASRYF